MSESGIENEGQRVNDVKTGHDLDNLRHTACHAIDSNSAELEKLSEEIWSHPEVYYQERRAHGVLTDFFARHGFAVEPHYKLETAFRATWKPKSACTDAKLPNVAILCEYDALPDIGHGCGHNLIAEVGAGAAVGLKAALLASGHPVGKITVLGTPAEEHGNGKIDLIDAGAFGDVDFALMSHPGWYSTVQVNFLCLRELRVSFYGRASHASCDPHEGLNALDAAVMAYSNISCLRQQMPKTCQIHGIISKGGSAPNIIPHETEMLYFVRASTANELEKFIPKVVACFEGAALSTGCTVKLEWSPKAALNVVTNRSLADSYTTHAQQMGVQFVDSNFLDQISMGGTDMGNVSYTVPSIHPIFYFGAEVTEHTAAFAKHAGSKEAQFYALREAKLLAQTALDVFFQSGLLQNIQREFEDDMKRFGPH